MSWAQGHTITTLFELYEFFRMPFRLRNAAQTFHMFIEQVLQGLYYCYAYTDELLIIICTSMEHGTHMQGLWRVRMTTTSLSIPDKCQLGVTQLEFLGHHVDHNSIRPLEDKALQTQYKLNEFLRLVNFYKQSILYCVEIWNETTKTAVNATKEALAKTTLLTPYSGGTHPVGAVL